MASGTGVRRGRQALTAAVTVTFTVAVTLALAACDASPEKDLVGSAHWGGMVVSVESRPSPPRPGNDELVVTLTDERRHPVSDVVVNLRARPDADWVQAIEDGHVGVYRRAVNFGGAGHAVLEMRLRRGAEEGALAFPVTVLAVR